MGELACIIISPLAGAVEEHDQRVAFVWPEILWEKYAVWQRIFSFYEDLLLISGIILRMSFNAA